MSDFLNASFFSRKISLFWFLIITVFFVGAGFYVLEHRPKEIQIVTQSSDCPTYMNQIRLSSGYTFIHPLLLTDLTTEDSRLLAVKSNIEQFISQKKREGVLTGISVYLRELDEGGWMAIYPDETYIPASLQKLTIMMSYIKDVEHNHALLDKKLYFDRHFENLPSQNIKVFSLKERQYYTVKDLLQYMIAYSDNDALNVLYQNMNNETYAKLFTDVQLPVPNLETDDYRVTVKDFTKFFRMLYSATYYDQPALSEYALKLLSESTYKEGMCKNLDPSITVAHKFGERVLGEERQLHEIGIVYLKDHPYLLGIMTKGHDFKQLADVLSGISDIVYAEMKPPLVN